MNDINKNLDGNRTTLIFLPIKQIFIEEIINNKQINLLSSLCIYAIHCVDCKLLREEELLFWSAIIIFQKNLFLHH